MTKYLTNLTVEQADNVSKELMRLSTGNAIEYSGTRFLLNRIKHQEREEWALVVPDEVRIPLIICDDIGYSINILLSLFDADLTEQEKIDLPALVRYRKSLPRNEQVVYLHEIEPQAVKDRQKTFEQMQAEGWLPVLVEA